MVLFIAFASHGSLDDAHRASIQGAVALCAMLRRGLSNRAGAPVHSLRVCVSPKGARSRVAWPMISGRFAIPRQCYTRIVLIFCLSFSTCPKTPTQKQKLMKFISARP